MLLQKILTQLGIFPNAEEGFHIMAWSFVDFSVV